MKENFQGGLLGAAIGDALGFPFKGLSAAEVSEYGRFESLRELQPVPSVRALPGELADEGQQLLLTLEGICTQRALDVPDLTRRLKGWFRSHPKDMTPLVRHVLTRLDAGEVADEAAEGASFDAQFNPPDGGHLTRCIPVALYRVRDADRRRADVTAVARLTHWDPVAVQVALVVGELLVQLVQGKLGSLDTCLPPDALPEVQAVVRSSREAEQLDVSGSALGVLGVGLWALNRSKTFEDGLVEVVSLGGATDTNAAVAGALLGAKFTRLALPQRWVYRLEGHARLEVLGTRLFELATLVTQR
ncbi:MAG: ADP-ribosylglycohydrolase family protein [Chloracidobacterium sp.]|uniref:ADP-ribosylglycohydrolase family protein n=1 Tax=Chloracidobacterium validum TaxID=2821543 RepID=A0ABX8BCT9_9BACT|nr:ADP-ribosylglycohydrolase family protein [Chloracidobacterium validum]QUW03464.1 ADP-ribosylglycohydrolase family protein [Chloracidobacterium validum]